LPDFDELLNISDSQPASLASIGNSANTAIAATTARRQRRPPVPNLANVLPDDGNACFPRVIRCARSRGSMAAPDADFNSLYAS
jgi:hypothetical protein